MPTPSIRAQLLYDRILIKRAIRAYKLKVESLKASRTKLGRPPHARYQVGDRVIHCRTLSMMNWPSEY